MKRALWIAAILSVFAWMGALNAWAQAGPLPPPALTGNALGLPALGALLLWTLLWVWLAWSLGLSEDAGLDAACVGALGLALANLWPMAALLPLPPPHDFLARKLAILCASAALLALGLALVSLLWAAWRARVWERFSPRRLALRLGGLLWIVYLLCGAWTWRWHLTGDSPHYLIYAANMAEGRGLNLRQAYEGMTWKRVLPLDRPLERQDALLPDGRTATEHKPLLPAVLAPAFFVGGWAGALWLHCGLAAMAAAIFFLGVFQLRASRTRALLAWALLAFCSPWWTYSATFYVELSAGVLLCVAFAAWTGAIPLAVAWLTPALLGSLSTRLLPGAGLLALLLAWRERKDWRRAAAPLVGLAAAYGIQAWINLDLWGSTSSSAAFAKAGFDSRDFFGPRWLPISLPGALLDQAYGLLPWAPVYVLAAAGLGAWWSRRDHGVWPLLVVVAPYLALLSIYEFWHGGMGPDRYLVGLAPFFALAAADGWAALRPRAAMLLAGLSLLLALLLQALPWFCYSKMDGGAWLWKLLGRPLHLQLTALLPSFIIVTPSSWVWALGSLAAACWLFQRGRALPKG